MDLRYPLGKFEAPELFNDKLRKTWIHDIRKAPTAVKRAIEGLSDNKLDTPYRTEGWTIRQVIHHMADSHMNSFIRFKLALTEDNPTIKPYHEDQWALLPDTNTAPVSLSLSLLEGLHKRWVILLESLTDEDFKRTFYHPDLGEVTLDTALALYAWHSKHHTAHITSLRLRMGW
ncbi:bacillithiol transferase BstA [Ectobacillus sp. JY-23]|uniref:YfiT family bacillithiol transferase n=1 Tax=Ectobacillus sp. JY-23 TaxID=2933872 RepID=UPI001FF3D318|nr:bacillithiol transferase BstA [Ectobacillus sp. JY-23]UOY91943.1 bacillithiol transferase BstA [Ectobacillus sp. JY-23]